MTLVFTTVTPLSPLPHTGLYGTRVSRTLVAMWVYSGNDYTVWKLCIDVDQLGRKEGKEGR